jgi:phosphopantothenoylcysteine decarboxylase/phosphopantothenate--cysteine ligase
MDSCIMAAAVADYTPSSPSGQKVKKSEATLFLELNKTKDILMELGKMKKDNQRLAGFALETENETENAIWKLHTKNLDFIVLNSLRSEGAGFNTETNQITIIGRDGRRKDFEKKPKSKVAEDILDYLADLDNNT